MRFSTVGVGLYKSLLLLLLIGRIGPWLDCGAEVTACRVSARLGPQESGATLERIDDDIGGLLAVQFRFGPGVGEICHHDAAEIQLRSAFLEAVVLVAQCCEEHCGSDLP